jgi:N-acetylneuraminate synthase
MPTDLNSLWKQQNEGPPLIVAELSGNHNQSLDRALKLVDAAAACGVDAIKLQTYTADTITLDITEGDFVINNPGSLWHGRTLHSLYDEAHTPWDWHGPIIRRASEAGLIWFSSPFDPTAVDFLETLHIPFYKVASPEIVDIPLLERIGATGKPVVMSTGMSTMEEIKDAVTALRSAGCKDLVLLKCTSTYPADPADSNLRALQTLGTTFDVPVGLSDHTAGVGVAVAAVAFGCVLIEKHLTLARADGGPDAAFSMEPAEMKMLVEEVHRAWKALGKAHLGPTATEKASMKGRRSLYVVTDVKAGEEITEQNVRSIRPGNGLPPKHLKAILGKRFLAASKRGTPMSWELVG